MLIKFNINQRLWTFAIILPKTIPFLIINLLLVFIVINSVAEASSTRAAYNVNFHTYHIAALVNVIGKLENLHATLLMAQNLKLCNNFVTMEYSVYTMFGRNVERIKSFRGP